MKGPIARSRREWVWPLVPVYAAGLAVKDGLRRVGVLPVRRLEWPVVSVGSLSAGGAGKTPVAIRLVELLKEREWGVDVLSRGYGRRGGAPGVERVSFDGAGAAARFGDEPVLIAQRTGVAVWVGKERYAAGRAAEESGAASDVRRRVHVLDDGFQHRGLGRAVDVVLVTEADLEDALLPAGNRREPLRALRRAGVVVLREEERARIEARVRRWMGAGAAVWGVRRELVLPAEVEAGTRLLGFCGIARPGGFWAMLAAAGIDLVERVEFGDHHGYSEADVERLAGMAVRVGASGFVTTEKDAVKLASPMLGRLGGVGRVHVARLDVRFADEGDVVRELEARIG